MQSIILKTSVKNFKNDIIEIFSNATFTSSHLLATHEDQKTETRLELMARLKIQLYGILAH